MRQLKRQTVYRLEHVYLRKEGYWLFLTLFFFFSFFLFQLVISPQYNKPIPVFEKPMKKDKDFIWYTLPFSSGNDEYK